MQRSLHLFAFVSRVQKYEEGIHVLCSLGWALCRCSRTPSTWVPVSGWNPLLQLLLSLSGAVAAKHAGRSIHVTFLYGSFVFILHAKEQPDCPMYVFVQSPQEILHYSISLVQWDGVLRLHQELVECLVWSESNVDLKSWDPQCHAVTISNLR